MKPYHIPYIGMVALSAALFLAACGRAQSDEHAEHAEDHNHDADEILFSPEQAKAACLATEVVSPSPFVEALKVSGRVLPTSSGEATVTATMAGLVDFAVSGITDGMSVHRGQSLFRLSASEMADGNPAAAAAAELETAQRAYERLTNLAKMRIVSAQELEQAEQRYATARAAVASLGSASQTRIVAAPLSGYVKAVLVKRGDYVAAGQPLATITQSRRLQLRAEVPERYYAYLSRIEGANFSLASTPAETVYRLADLNGRLIARGHAVDADERFVPVTFEFDNVGDIIAGSLAEVFLLTKPQTDALTVPISALTEEQGVYYVYLKTSAHTYRKAEVQLGGSDGSRVVVASGVKAGDSVVVRGAIQVKLAATGTAIPEGHKH